MDETLLTVLISVFELPVIILILVLLKYLFNKGKIELNQRQWELLQDAVYDAVQYAEQQAFKIEKKGEKKLTSEEKFELASGFAQKLLKKFNLADLSTFIAPLIEAKVKELFNN